MSVFKRKRLWAAVAGALTTVLVGYSGTAYGYVARTDAPSGSAGTFSYNAQGQAQITGGNTFYVSSVSGSGNPLSTYNGIQNDHFEYATDGITIDNGNDTLGGIYHFDLVSAQGVVQDSNNGYLEVGQSSISQWITALKGDSTYVSARLWNTIFTDETPGYTQTFPVSDISQIVNMSGASFAPNDPTYNHTVYATNPPSSVAVDFPSGSTAVQGTSLAMNLQEGIEAYHANYHYEYLQVVGADGKDYTSQAGFSYEGAVTGTQTLSTTLTHGTHSGQTVQMQEVKGGGTTSYPPAPVTTINGGGGYSSPEYLNTGSLPAQSYTVYYQVKDYYNRAGTAASASFTVTPAVGPTVSLTANPTTLAPGQSSTLTATATNVPINDYILIKDLTAASLGGSSTYSDGVTGETSLSTQAIYYSTGTLNYTAELVNKSTGAVDATASQISIVWQQAQQATISLTASPTLAQSGQNVALTYNSSGWLSGDYVILSAINGSTWSVMGSSGTSTYYQTEYPTNGAQTTVTYRALLYNGQNQMVAYSSLVSVTWTSIAPKITLSTDNTSLVPGQPAHLIYSCNALPSGDYVDIVGIGTGAQDLWNVANQTNTLEGFTETENPSTGASIPVHYVGAIYDANGNVLSQATLDLTWTNAWTGSISLSANPIFLPTESPTNLTATLSTALPSGYILDVIDQTTHTTIASSATGTSLTDPYVSFSPETDTFIAVINDGYENVGNPSNTVAVTWSELTLNANPALLPENNSTTLTLAAQNMPNGDYLVLYNTTKGQIVGTTQSGTLTVNQTQPDAETDSYIGYLNTTPTVGGYDTSNPVTVDWYGVTLTASPTDLPVGQTSTVTATAQNLPGGYVIDIEDTTTGQVIASGQPGQPTLRVLQSKVQAATDQYVAQVVQPSNPAIPGLTVPTAGGNISNPFVQVPLTTVDSSAEVFVNGLLYVTGAANNTVDVINTATNQVIGSIAVGRYPDAITYANGYLYVVNQLANSVSVVNVTTNAVVATIPVGSGPVDLTYYNGEIYVDCWGAGIVSVIDTSTNSLSKTTPWLSWIGTSIAAGNGYVYMTFEYTSSIRVYSVATGGLVTSIPLTTSSLGDLYFANGYLYVANRSAKTVQVINPSTNTIVNTISLVMSGFTPQSFAYDQGYLYVRGYNGYIAHQDDVGVINTATNQLVAVLPFTGDNAYHGIATAQGNVYVTGFVTNDLYVINETWARTPESLYVPTDSGVYTGVDGLGTYSTLPWTSYYNTGKGGSVDYDKTDNELFITHGGGALLSYHLGNNTWYTLGSPSGWKYGTKALAYDPTTGTVFVGAAESSYDNASAAIYNPSTNRWISLGLNPAYTQPEKFLYYPPLQTVVGVFWDLSTNTNEVAYWSPSMGSWVNTGCPFNDLTNTISDMIYDPTTQSILVGSASSTHYLEQWTPSSGWQQTTSFWALQDPKLAYDPIAQTIVAVTNSGYLDIYTDTTHSWIEGATLGLTSIGTMWINPVTENLFLGSSYGGVSTLNLRTSSELQSISIYGYAGQFVGVQNINAGTTYFPFWTFSQLPPYVPTSLFPTQPAASQNVAGAIWVDGKSSDPNGTAFFEGSFNLSQTSQVSFATNADDYVQVYVDGTPIMQSGGSGGVGGSIPNTGSTSVWLPAGEHQVIVEVENNNGFASPNDNPAYLSLTASTGGTTLLSTANPWQWLTTGYVTQLPSGFFSGGIGTWNWTEYVMQETQSQPIYQSQAYTLQTVAASVSATSVPVSVTWYDYQLSLSANPTQLYEGSPTTLSVTSTTGAPSGAVIQIVNQTSGKVVGTSAANASSYSMQYTEQSPTTDTFVAYFVNPSNGYQYAYSNTATVQWINAPLTLSGAEVYHTPQWLSNLNQYNTYYSTNNPSLVRPLSDFWAGEELLFKVKPSITTIAQANVTISGLQLSPYVPANPPANFSGTFNIPLTYDSATGYLEGNTDPNWEPWFEYILDGTYTVQFTVKSQDNQVATATAQFTVNAPWISNDPRSFYHETQGY